MPSRVADSVILLLLLLLLLLAPRLAAADSPSLEPAYSPYEQQAIDDAASELHTTVDPAPAGKRVEHIDYVRIDPIDRHDPAPRWLDVAHVTTRVFVLRREVLVAEGARWDQARVDESARNLRALSQLSLVLCIPMRGSAPDRVRLVVITKDVWSLYPDFDVSGTGRTTTLTLEPKETNLAGLQHTLMGRFVLDPSTYSVGASYEVPRLDGQFLDLQAEGNVVFDKTTGVVEGSYGTATAERPLFSSRTEWAWLAAFKWNDTIFRLYNDSGVSRWSPGPSDAVAGSVGSAGSVPWQYRQRTLGETLQVTRSFGVEQKNDVAIGFALSRARYAATFDADPALASAFTAAVVPRSDDRVGPFVQWHTYTNDFMHVLDVDTLSLQEDQRLGHEIWLRVYPVLRALGSSRELLGTYAAAAYTVPLGDGFTRAAVQGTVEAERTFVPDTSVTGDLVVVTPRTGIGRLVFEATATDRVRNSLRVMSFLGGNNRLRGYPSNALAGADVFSANLEYRSRPVSVASVQLAGVLFYDVGDASSAFDQFRPKHSVGFGLRAVFPQIERPVFRLDVGFPVGPKAPGFGYAFAFHQAVPIPAIGVGLGP
jgi:hypothetical protein